MDLTLSIHSRRCFVVLFRMLGILDRSHWNWSNLIHVRTFDKICDYSVENYQSLKVMVMNKYLQVVTTAWSERCARHLMLLHRKGYSEAMIKYKELRQRKECNPTRLLED
jgi:hypothetical protein